MWWLFPCFVLFFSQRLLSISLILTWVAQSLSMWKLLFTVSWMKSKACVAPERFIYSTNLCWAPSHFVGDSDSEAVYYPFLIWTLSIIPSTEHFFLHEDKAGCQESCLAFVRRQGKQGKEAHLVVEGRGEQWSKANSQKHDTREFSIHLHCFLLVFAQFPYLSLPKFCGL